MSDENVEIWRANLEGQLAALSAGASPEATISEMAEIWDPEIELDASDGRGDVGHPHVGADDLVLVPLFHALVAQQPQGAGPLLVGDDDSPLPLIDSMRVHAEAAAELALRA